MAAERSTTTDALTAEDAAARRSAKAWVGVITETAVLRRFGLAVIAVIVVLQVFFWLFYGARHFLFLLLLSWLFAIAMEPAVGWLARRGMRRGYATGIVMIALFIAVVGFFAIFGALLLEQVVSLVQALPDALVSLVDWVNNTFSTDFDADQINDSLAITPEQVAKWASTLGLGLFGFFTSLVGVVFDFFIVLLFAFYFSAEGPRIRRVVASWLPQESQRVVHNVWEVAVQKTGGYVASRLILALIASIITSVFLFIIDVPYWLPLGIWTGVVSQFIPTLGTYLGGALPALFAFSASVWDGVLVIVFVIVYQQVENYFLSPRVSNRTMNIHPAIAFGAVLVGAALGGALGALIAIPIVASIQSLIETYGRRYELIPELATDVGHPLAERAELPFTKARGKKPASPQSDDEA
jgi:predicted PurR-regulated permease PerM